MSVITLIGIVVVGYFLLCLVLDACEEISLILHERKARQHVRHVSPFRHDGD